MEPLADELEMVRAALADWVLEMRDTGFDSTAVLIAMAEFVQNVQAKAIEHPGMMQ